jgi:DNA-binding CsgD family transcriptional regulator
MDAVIQKKGVVVVTERNVSIINAYSNGYSLDEISKKHKISLRTAEAIVAKLKAEFECKHISHLVATFLRKGLIK